MIIIRATCPTCGDVKLSSDQVIIRTCVGRSGGEYRWHCKCGIVVKHAEDNIIALLRQSEVKEEVWELPLEMIERPQEGSLTEDDLIDFELAVKDGSLFERLTNKNFNKE